MTGGCCAAPVPRRTRFDLKTISRFTTFSLSAMLPFVRIQARSNCGRARTLPQAVERPIGVRFHSPASAALCEGAADLAPRHARPAKLPRDVGGRGLRL